ncbi:MAG: hypothetical protein LBQ43_02740, partial [Holosporales bacterium]|nr:hypothetical protein [Holosporales bacterium]
MKKRFIEARYLSVLFAFLNCVSVKLEIIEASSSDTSSSEPSPNSSISEPPLSELAVRTGEGTSELAKVDELSPPRDFVRTHQSEPNKIAGLPGQVEEMEPFAHRLVSLVAEQGNNPTNVVRDQSGDDIFIRVKNLLCGIDTPYDPHRAARVLLRYSKRNSHLRREIRLAIHALCGDAAGVDNNDVSELIAILKEGNNWGRFHYLRFLGRTNIPEKVDEATDLLIAMADSGFVPAQVELGESLLYKCGFVNDMARLRKHFELLANKDVPYGQLYYGMYLRDTAFKRASEQTSERGLKQALEQAWEQTLGQTSEEAFKQYLKRVSKQALGIALGEAACYLGSSADKGNMLAQFEVIFGFGIPKNLKDFRFMYERLVMKNDGIRKYRDATNFRKFFESRDFSNDEKVRQTIENFRSAADDGISAAQITLAHCYKTGDGVPKDLSEALKFYRMAARKGSLPGQLGYARLVLKNIDQFGQYLESAIRRLGSAIAKENPSALNMWGYCLENGIGVKKDKLAAASSYKKAADKGHVKGILNYGRCLEFGIGVPKDLVSAVHCYCMSGRLGSSAGEFNYGRCQLHGIGTEQDEGSVLASLRSASEHGNADASLYLGAYHLSDFELRRDEVKAIEYLKLSANQGSIPAQMYLIKAGMVPVEEATKFLGKAAEKGNLVAQLEYAIHLLLEGGNEREIEAYRLIELAKANAYKLDKRLDTRSMISTFHDRIRRDHCYEHKYIDWVKILAMDKNPYALCLIGTYKDGTYIPLPHQPTYGMSEPTTVSTPSVRSAPTPIFAWEYSWYYQPEEEMTAASLPVLYRELRDFDDGDKFRSPST